MVYNFQMHCTPNNFIITFSCDQQKAMANVQLNESVLNRHQDKQVTDAIESTHQDIKCLYEKQIKPVMINL